jgi:hypothetical protein
MSIEFEAEIRSELTGRSYNRCLDELYEEQNNLYEDQMIQQMRYEKEAREQYEAEMREVYKHEEELIEQHEAKMREVGEENK